MAQVIKAPIKVDAWVASGQPYVFGWKVTYGDVYSFNAHPMTFIQDSFPQVLEIDHVQFKAEGPPNNRLWAVVTITNANYPDGCNFGIWVTRTTG